MKFSLCSERVATPFVALGAPLVGVVVQETERTRPRTVDHDLGKGTVEDDQTSGATNAPGLDADGLPNDHTAIAQDAIGARADGSQG